MKYWFRELWDNYAPVFVALGLAGIVAVVVIIGASSGSSRPRCLREECASSTGIGVDPKGEAIPVFVTTCICLEYADAGRTD